MLLAGIGDLDVSTANVRRRGDEEKRWRWRHVPSATSASMTLKAVGQGRQRMNS